MLKQVHRVKVQSTFRTWPKVLRNGFQVMAPMHKYWQMYTRHSPCWATEPWLEVLSTRCKEMSKAMVKVPKGPWQYVLRIGFQVLAHMHKYWSMSTKHSPCSATEPRLEVSRARCNISTHAQMNNAQIDGPTPFVFYGPNSRGRRHGTLWGWLF